MRRLSPKTILTLLPVFFFWLSCSAPSARRLPESKRLDRVRSLVEQSDDREVYLVRFNPTVCTCPPFELRLGKHWVRIELVGQTATEDEVRAIRKRASGQHEEKPSQIYRIKGEPDATRIGICGASYPVLDFEFQGEETDPEEKPDLKRPVPK
jgi:hypothetical protein